MRIKTDYMGNNQLLPAYNLQFGICDEYIAIADINQYACDMDCFVPLMSKFKKQYGIIYEIRFIQKRIVRRGLKAVNLVIFMISCGYNLMKYHVKKYRVDYCF